MSSRRGAALIFAALLSVLACGCATVPTGGPVSADKIPQGGGLGSGGAQGQDLIQLIPPSPQPGWSSDEIVSGFLLASADFRRDHAVAREYLAPEIQRSWSPGSSVAVFAQAPAVQPFQGDAASVQVTGREIATINDGQYETAPSTRTGSRVFGLRKVNGQWRISQPPGELLLTQRDVDRAYRSRDLYFFEPSFNTLVPDPIFVPILSPADPVTGLVKDLVNGPKGWLGKATTTAFPAGTTLLGATVNDGVLTVNLGGAAAQARGSLLALMSAQILWTLGQFSVAQVVLKINGTAAQVSSGSSQGDPGAWPPGPPPHVFYVDPANRVLMLGDSGNVPAAGLVGGSPPRLTKLAVSFDLRQIAGVSGNTLYTGDLRQTRPQSAGTQSPGALVSRLKGNDLTAPSWDRDGNVWVATSAGGHSEVWMLPNGRNPVQVTVPGDLGPIRALRVARDGARVAMITGSGGDTQLWLGGIVRSGDQAAIDLGPAIGTDLNQLTYLDLTWYNADQLVVLTQQSDGASQLYVVPVDGTASHLIGTQQGTVAITAAGPSNPLVAGLLDGQLVSAPDTNGLSWRAQGSGQMPVYPG